MRLVRFGARGAERPGVLDAEGTLRDVSGVARDYDPAASYEVGDVVYHRSINSYGRVLEKRVLPGQRAAIRVQFDDGEEMTLRERTG